MANPQKGEVEFEIGGKTYTYLLGSYGLAKLEQRMGKPWPVVLQTAVNNGWGVDIALACFHAGLLLHHEPMTEKQASVLLDEMGLEQFTTRFVGAVAAMFPDQKGDDLDRIDVRPPVAVDKGNGIGTALSETGSSPG